VVKYECGTLVSVPHPQIRIFPIASDSCLQDGLTFKPAQSGPRGTKILGPVRRTEPSNFIIVYDQLLDT